MKKFKFILSTFILFLVGYVCFQYFLGNTVDKDMQYKVLGAQVRPVDNTDSVSNSSQKDDFSVVVKSPIYNAMVSLDEKSREIKVKLLDDSFDYDSVKHYLNLSDEDIQYLSQSADALLDKFKGGNLMDKYTLVSDMLKSYDTNVTQGDLISLGLSFFK